MSCKKAVIVGAGFSGLYAATTLSNAGFSVTVLEAQNRVGGRSYTEIKKGRVVDQGAGYVGSSQTAVLGLIEQFGMETNVVPGDGAGMFTFSLGGVVHHSDNVLADLFLYLSWYEFIAVGIAIIETYCKGMTIPLDKPWEAPNAHEWDSMTVENWINEKFPSSIGNFDNAKTIFRFICRTPLGIEAWETSFLYFLWYLKSAGGFFSILFPAQEKTVVGGTQQIAERLKEQLPDSSVNLEKPVTLIKQDDEKVTVTSGSEQYEADHCILAITPHSRSRILYEPLLSPVYHQLPQRSPMGTTIKVHLFYNEKFWVEKGYNGNATIFDGTSVSQVYDVTEPNGKPCLQGFYVGNTGRLATYQTPAEREANVKAELARVFESDKALDPIHYDEYIWDDHPYVGGAPVGTCAAGTLTSFGSAIRNHTGRIYFASTETSTLWAGYMDGALRAGHRAACELLDAHNLPQPEPLPSVPDSTEKYMSYLKKILHYLCKSAKIWQGKVKGTTFAKTFCAPCSQKEMLDSLMKQGIDNNNNWLSDYIAAHADDVGTLCASIKQLVAGKSNSELLIQL